MIVLKDNRIIRSRAQLAREIVKTDDDVFLAFDRKNGQFFHVWPDRVDSVADALWRVRERRRHRLHVGKQINGEEELIGQLMLITYSTEVEYVIINGKKICIHNGKDLAKIFAEW
jgi:hypothetical protein